MDHSTEYPSPEERITILNALPTAISNIPREPACVAGLIIEAIMNFRRHVRLGADCFLLEQQSWRIWNETRPKGSKLIDITRDLVEDVQNEIQSKLGRNYRPSALCQALFGIPLDDRTMCLTRAITYHVLSCGERVSLCASTFEYKEVSDVPGWKKWNDLQPNGHVVYLEHVTDVPPPVRRSARVANRQKARGVANRQKTRQGLPSVTAMERGR